MRALLCSLLGLFCAQPVAAQCVLGLAVMPCDLPPIRTVTVPGTRPTLQSALANAQPGDHIVLSAGTYTGPFVASIHGTQARPIVIRAAAPEAVTLTASTTQDVLWLSGRWYQLRNVEVTGGWQGVVTNAQYTLLRDVFVHDTRQQGVLILHSDTGLHRLTQRRAGLADPNPWQVHGVYVSDYYGRNIARVTVQDSDLRENGGGGFQVWNSTRIVRDVHLLGTHLEQNATGAILTNVERGQIVGNTFVQHGHPPTTAPITGWLRLELSKALYFTGNTFTASVSVPACTPIAGYSQSLAQLWWSGNTWSFPAGCVGYDDAALNAAGGH